MKVHIVGMGAAFEAMFERRGWEVVPTLEEADFVQFTGGADVSPEFYGELPHYRTMSDKARDEYEAAVYQQAVSLDKNLLGVCRGAQFLNVLNGGSLFQHVDGHGMRETHECTSNALGAKFQVTSTHHQMMRPGLDAEVEGWCDGLTTTKEYMRDDVVVMKDSPVDIEVVYYSMTKSLCFQPHPEYVGADSTESYYFQLIHHYYGAA